MRWVGAVLLSAGSAALGLGAVVHLDSRVRDLRGLIAGLSAMERALTARLEPLDGMLSGAAESAEGRPQEFFQFCRRGVARLAGRSFAGLWESALEAVPLRLEEADLSILRQLGGVLGRYDADSQAAALLQAVKQLEEQLAEGQEQRRRLGKVYGTMGVAAGLFFTILLL